MTIINNSKILDYFRKHELEPAKINHRYDRTIELIWHVDDVDDRYVRLTTSANSTDCAIVARNLRAIESVVLGDLKSMLEWTRDHLLRMDTKGAFASVSPPSAG
jgi:hypothetical protein